MLPLNLPPAKLKLSKKDGVLSVICQVRKKSLVLTHEEWVRQHAIHYLIAEKKVPSGRIASEATVKIDGHARRCDIVVVGETGDPLLIVECKAPEIQLSETTFLQVSNYVRQLRSSYFWMTNGLQHAVAKIEASGFAYISDLPDYSLW
jgi:hypothetical protein